MNKLQEKDRAFTYQFLTDKEYFLEKKNINEKREEFRMDMIDVQKLDKNKLENILKVGEANEVKSFIEGYFNTIGREGLKSLMFRQYLLMDMYFTIVRFIEEQKISSDQRTILFEDAQKLADVLSTEEKTKQFLIELIEETIHKREEIVKNRYEEILLKVRAYIAMNYADDTLSLNSLAAYVNLSPNHLSMVFSQHAGSTFIKYLTDFRMNKAKELLKCTRKKSNEISIMVGYKDPHYFSYLFKKTQNITPTQYRGA